MLCVLASVRTSCAPLVGSASPQVSSRPSVWVPPRLQHLCVRITLPSPSWHVKTSQSLTHHRKAMGSLEILTQPSWCFLRPGGIFTLMQQSPYVYGGYPARFLCVSPTPPLDCGLLWGIRQCKSNCLLHLCLSRLSHTLLGWKERILNFFFYLLRIHLISGSYLPPDSKLYGPADLCILFHKVEDTHEISVY